MGRPRGHHAAGLQARRVQVGHRRSSRLDGAERLLRELGHGGSSGPPLAPRRSRADPPLSGAWSAKGGGRPRRADLSQTCYLGSIGDQVSGGPSGPDDWTPEDRDQAEWLASWEADGWRPEYPWGGTLRGDQRPGGHPASLSSATTMSFDTWASALFQIRIASNPTQPPTSSVARASLETSPCSLTSTNSEEISTVKSMGSSGSSAMKPVHDVTDPCNNWEEHFIDRPRMRWIIRAQLETLETKTVRLRPASRLDGKL